MIETGNKDTIHNINKKIRYLDGKLMKDVPRYSWRKLVDYKRRPEWMMRLKHFPESKVTKGPESKNIKFPQFTL